MITQTANTPIYFENIVVKQLFALQENKQSTTPLVTSEGTFLYYSQQYEN